MPSAALLERRQAARRRQRRTRMAVLATLLLAVGAVAAALLLASGGNGGSARQGAARATGGATPPSGGGAHHLGPKPDPEQQAIDRVLRHHTLIRSGGPKRMVALTFDDGPSPYTARIVAILKRKHAPATFFQIGRMIPVYKAGEDAARRSGLPLGDHTQRHPPLAALGPALQRQEIVQAAQSMRAAGEPFPRMFRPPYLSYNRTTLAIARDLHMLVVTWNVDPHDYTQPGATVIRERVLSAVTPGAIVLMHDGGGYRSQEVVALPGIIDALRRRGYKLVSVPQMLVENPPVSGARRALRHRLRHHRALR